MSCRGSTDCRVCHLQGSSRLLLQAASNSVERLAKAHESRTFPRGTLLYQQGSPNSQIYCVTSGLIKIYHTNSKGDRHILYLAAGGDFLGMPQLLSGRALAEHSAEAVTPTLACQIQGETLMKVLESDPQVAMNVLRSLADGLGKAEARFLSQVNSSVPVRLAHLLIECGKYESGGEIAPLSREEMAQVAGTTEVLVARWIRLWVRKGFLKTRGTALMVCEPQALLAFVRG